jgi:hypothetical protein
MPDAPELRAFVLNESLLHKFLAASVALDSYAGAHPDQNVKSARDLNGMVANLNSSAQSRAILAKNSISARDYSRTFVIVLGGVLYVGMERAGAPMKSAPDYLSPANLDFIRAHYDELQKLTSGQ